MPKVWLCQSQTPHKRGEFSNPAAPKNMLLIMQFSTDFVYHSSADNTLAPGKPGEFVIFTTDGNITHGPAVHMNEGFVNDWIFMQGNDAIEMAESLGLPFGTAFEVTVPGLMRKYITKIEREKLSGQYERQLVESAVCTELLVDIARKYREQLEKSKPKGAVLEKIRTQMLENYKSDWSLEKLATESGYSVSRFSALYKQTYGISPIDELIRRRLEEAKAMLYEGNLSVTEIASRCGFSSLHYFSYCFKKFENVTPSALIRKS